MEQRSVAAAGTDGGPERGAAILREAHLVRALRIVAQKPLRTRQTPAGDLDPARRKARQRIGAHG